MSSSLETTILYDIEDRQSVLSEIERALFTNRYDFSQKHKDVLTIQSISMIYSIWEGYVQKSFSTYIDELNRKGIQLANVSDSLLAYNLETNFRQLKEYPKKPQKKVKFLRDLMTLIDSNILVLKPVVDTKSNVSFDVLNNLLITFSLPPFEEFWGEYKHPNPSLKDTMDVFLRYRNGIAHGGDISSEEKVTHDVYKRYKKLVNELMYAVMFKMLDGFSEESFKK